MSIFLTDIAAYLNSYLEIEHVPGERNGIYQPVDRPIRRIGLALEAWPEIVGWVESERLDALLVHHPWQLQRYAFSTDPGILGYHLPFDLRLTAGYNPRLADVLHMRHVQPFPVPGQTPLLGMLGDILPVRQDRFLRVLTEIFGVVPRVENCLFAPDQAIQRIAVVGALNDRFIQAADEQGVQVYVTGQWRPGTQQAVAATNILVVALGHVAVEQWGLRSLGALLSERWTYLEVAIAPPFLCVP